MLKVIRTTCFCLLCVLNTFLIFKFFDTESGLPAYKELQLKIKTVQERIEDIDGKSRQLSSEIRALKTDVSYMDRLIKRKLFYVADNEIMYVVK